MEVLEQYSLLTIGLPTFSIESSDIRMRIAGTGREVLAMSRVLNFDLLMTGAAIPDMSVWSLIQRIRRQSNNQKWVLVAPELTPEDQIKAWSLGVLAIFDQPPESADLEQVLSATIGQRATVNV